MIAPKDALQSTLLTKAEWALSVGAFGGLSAALALFMFSWSLALIAAGIAVSALLVAVVLFTIPSSALSHTKARVIEGVADIPKKERVESQSDLTLSTRRILESTGTHPEVSMVKPSQSVREASMCIMKQELPSEEIFLKEPLFRSKSQTLILPEDSVSAGVNLGNAIVK